MAPVAIEKPVTATTLAPTGDDELFEIINGARVVLPPMSIFASLIATQLIEFLAPYARSHNLGRLVSEGLFHLPPPADRDRRPDIAFVSYQRWPKNRPARRTDNAWDVVPDMAVEVVSPTDIAENLQEKIAEYFRAGVRAVWIVYPLHARIYVYDTATQVRILTAADELDGGAILPGFRLALAELFPESDANGATH